MKSILIARVSTEEQKELGNSLPAQLDRLRRYSNTKGFPILNEFSFDESAYKENREGFDEILDFVINQKEKVAVCFDKVDRLSRNVFDKRVSVLYEKAVSDNIELHFVSDNQVISSRISATEKFQFGISLGLAKYYSDAISDNVKRVFEQKIREGIWLAKAPYGYKNVDLDDDKKDIVISEYESKIVRKIFELYSSNAYSISAICNKLKADYKLDWHRAKLEKILKNPFYKGCMLWKGKTYAHKYPIIVNEELFNLVQNLKEGNARNKRKVVGLPYLYRGLLRCTVCGCSITPQKHKGHVYYHCTQYHGNHNAPYIREEKLTQQFSEMLQKIKVPESVVEQILDTLKDNHNEKSKFRETQIQEIYNEREKFAKRIEQLYIDKLDQRITESQYDKFHTSFRSKIAEMDARLSILQDAEDKYYLTSKYLLELLNKAHTLFESSKPDQKREILNLILLNPRLDNENLCYDYKKPFDVFVNFNECNLWGGWIREVRTCFSEQVC